MNSETRRPRTPRLAASLLAGLALSGCGADAPPATAGPDAEADAVRVESPDAAPTGGDAEAPPDDEARAIEALMAGIRANPWVWTSFAGEDESVTVQTPGDYTVTFKDDGTLDIQADCASAQGSYALDGPDVTIEIDMDAVEACPGDSRSQEFLALLAGAKQILPTGGEIFVPQTTGDGLMVLTAVVTRVADLCGEDALELRTIEDGLSPEVGATLDEGLASLVEAGVRPGPGASMLIITPEGRYLKSVGVADVDTCEPLAADSHFQIGSNTKMMTAAVVFQLQEEGVLSTSDLIAGWLPDLAARLPYGERITIDMMLTHTSGLHDYFDIPTADGTTIEDGIRDEGMLTRAFTPEELVTLVAESGLSEFEPGAEGRWSYSNTGFILLGLIIEAATGTSYEENLRARILEPLGLSQTYLQPDVPEPGLLPRAYYGSPFDFATSGWNASQGWAAGAVVSTPDDFAIFLEALFTGRLFDDPDTLERMLQPTEASADELGPGVSYGRGMSDNNGVLGHGGQTLGFQSEAGYLPGADVTLVIWSNSAESGVARTIVPMIAGVVTAGG